MLMNGVKSRMTDERKERVSDENVAKMITHWHVTFPEDRGRLLKEYALDLRDCRAERDELRERVRELE
jgi:hypothetical protein